MLKFLVGIAAVAITAASTLNIYDHVEVFAARAEAERQLVSAREQAVKSGNELMASLNAEAEKNNRKAEGLKVCDQPYWEYRRGQAADSVAKPRMEELRKIITDCNTKYGTDFSL